MVHGVDERFVILSLILTKFRLHRVRRRCAVPEVSQYNLRSDYDSHCSLLA